MKPKYCALCHKIITGYGQPTSRGLVHRFCYILKTKERVGK